jgi:Opioid growth factor receptor (OGFr) conserved region
MAGNPIVAFYRDGGTDHRGRSLGQLQSQSLRELEEVHDYIQWFFPLDKPSSASRHAPILTSADIQVFVQGADLRERLLQSLRTMLNFYGLTLGGTSESTTVLRSPTFPSRAAEWLRPSNHNFLRLTRILRSLSLLGCRDHARALLGCLEGIYAENARIIGKKTMHYWRSACLD